MTSPHPQTEIRRLGILGGTFDPIHLGHLTLARVAADQIGLDSVWIIPASAPPHKRDRSIAPADFRWEMVTAAAQPYAPLFVPKDIELKREGFSYTADTVAQIRDIVGPETEIYWIIGIDNVGQIPHWYRPREICETVMIAAGGRPGSQLPDDLPDWLSSRLVRLNGPDLDISSTAIREEAARGIIDPAKVPPGVADVIRREKLYGFTSA